MRDQKIYFINTEFEWIKFLPAMLKIYYVPCFIFTFLNIKKKLYSIIYLYITDIFANLVET